MATDIRSISYSQELAEGARNAIETCLRVRADERVTVITDRATATVAASLMAQVERLGGNGRVFVLEDFAARPMKVMPLEILFELGNSAVGIYAATPQPGEVFARGQAIRLASKRKIRFGHMVGITEQVMMEAMRADFFAINRMSLRLLRTLRETRHVRVTTAAGTNLEAFCQPPRYRWVKTSGLISRDIWGNLPGGEIFTCPASVNGVFVANATIGDHFCEKYGDLERTPLIVKVKDGRLESVYSDRRDLAEEFYDYCHSEENSDRVGEFAIGTNLSVKRFIGNMLQDEKHPGIHIAFGEPCGNLTGADWRAKTHVDLLTRGTNFWLDGVQYMADDRFLFDGDSTSAA
ncbi:MAG: aminopeptidase [Nevskia sp.]|nr:aminopeptidase [Nevskia sp.]